MTSRIHVCTLLAFAAVCSSCSSESNDLKLSARSSGGELIIKNIDSVGVSSCLATINGKYSYNIQSLLPFVEVSIPLREFSDSEGARLLPIFVKVNDIAVTCSQPSFRSTVLGSS